MSESSKTQAKCYLILSQGRMCKTPAQGTLNDGKFCMNITSEERVWEG